MYNAICCMTMQPEHFEFWIHHHLVIVGFDYILLRIENTDYSIIPEKYAKQVIICQEENLVDSHIDSIVRQQDRQINFVNWCLEKVCPKLKIEHLLHIDDDELLVLHKDYKSIQDIINRYPSFGNLRFQNYEAVLRFTPCRPEYFFQTTWFKNGSLEQCRSYRNGKSMTPVNLRNKCNGCHTFTGLWTKVEEKDAIILHYDSITFERWKKKFEHLKTFTIAPNTFVFYKKCIDLFSKNVSENELYSFWRQEIQKADFPIDISLEYNFSFCTRGID